MNERLRELLKQSTNPPWDGEQGPMNEFNKEKFAELIVRECLSQVDKIRDGCEADNEDLQALGADWAGLAVARHFGVEE